MTGHVQFSADAIGRLTARTEPWLSCDDCFEQADGVIEGVLTTPGPMPELFRLHLLACAACHEDAISLAAIIGPDFAMTSGVALERVERALRFPDTHGENAAASSR